MADITSTSNHRVKLARKLQRKRYRDQTGLCLLEGVRLIEDAAVAGVQIEALFVTETADQTGTNDSRQAVLASLQAGGTAVYTVTPEVLAAMTETIAPQGVAALAHIPDLPLPSSPSLVLVLDALRDPGNVGTLLRSAAAAGVDLVLFGPQTVDAYNDKVLRAGMGAHFRLPLHVCQEWAEVKGMVDALAIYVADAGGALPYDGVAWQQPSALIVGGEASGPGQEARRLGVGVAIPMVRRTESLNAAVAGSIILFEAARQRRQGAH